MKPAVRLVSVKPDGARSRSQRLVLGQMLFEAFDQQVSMGAKEILQRIGAKETQCVVAAAS